MRLPELTPHNLMIAALVLMLLNTAGLFLTVFYAEYCR
jgi:hypothetical protein